MDPIVAGQFTSLTVMSAQQGMALTGVIDRNLVQGLGTAQNIALTSMSLTSDDGQIIAALQTASRAPIQGSNALPK